MVRGWMERRWIDREKMERKNIGSLSFSVVWVRVEFFFLCVFVVLMCVDKCGRFLWEFFLERKVFVLELYIGE